MTVATSLTSASRPRRKIRRTRERQNVASSPTRVEPTVNECCPPATHDTCCEPSAKPGCCGAVSNGCGCR